MKNTLNEDQNLDYSLETQYTETRLTSLIFTRLTGILYLAFYFKPFSENLELYHHGPTTRSMVAQCSKHICA